MTYTTVTDAQKNETSNLYIFMFVWP